MNIINLPRAAGKTSQAAKLSAQLNIPVLCINSDIIRDRAKEFNLSIPTPIEVRNLSHLKELPESVIIDELEIVLQEMFRVITDKRIGVKVATLSDDENSKKVRIRTCGYKDISMKNPEEYEKEFNAIMKENKEAMKNFV